MKKTIVTLLLILGIYSFQSFFESKEEAEPAATEISLQSDFEELKVSHSVESEPQIPIKEESVVRGISPALKLQFKKDLKMVDQSLGVKPRNKRSKKMPGERRLAQDDLRIIEMMDQQSNELNNGSNQDSSNEDLTITEELKKEVQ